MTSCHRGNNGLEDSNATEETAMRKFSTVVIALLVAVIIGALIFRRLTEDQ
jgi:hypothetical protein